MIDILENPQLSTDLDAMGHNLLNVASLLPTPPSLVGQDDTRLTDARTPLPGSITNLQVADNANIAQSKINFNGSIPFVWLGLGSGLAAPGDQAEYLANKGQPGGYAALDSGGQVPSGQLPALIGTVTSVALTMPAEFDVSGSPVTSAGTIDVTWVDVPDGSWFGNKSGLSGPPTFNTDPLPIDLIPDLDASKITSGTIDAARLPAAVGVGVGHAPGIVPDPGGSGDATDYLARDMTYKAVPSIGPTYQPDVDDPTFSTTSGGGDASVAINCPTDGVSIFYSLTSDSVDFQEYTGMFTVATPQDIWAYAAKEGYNNSNVVTVSLS